MNKLAFVTCVLISTTAEAFIDPPIFDLPNALPADTEIGFSVRTGICDAFPIASTTVFTTIEQQDGLITFTVPGIRARDVQLCNIPIFSPRFRIAPLPPGHYVLQFRVRDVQRPDEVYLVAPVPFTVGRAPVIRSEAVPGLNSAGMAILALGMFGVAAVGLRKRAIG